MSFSVKWTVGSNAMAGMRKVGGRGNQAALVLTLDPGSVVMSAPSGPTAWPGFVRFLRQLRDGVDEMIKEYDVQDKNEG